ncbi:OsmC family protein [bacterium]|nr:OsmC family protein [bacterium]
MHPLPHQYRVQGSGGADGAIAVTGAGLPPLAAAAPPQFGGPGDQWSPETLLIGAVVTCFVLTFRAIAQASKLTWVRLTCDGDGTLDRIEGVTRFTAIALRAHLVLSAEAEREKAARLLEKAERACLVTNSLALRPVLACEIEVV